MRYFVNILVLVNLYVILATSYNLILGYAGLLSVAHAVFYGLGAYTSAIVVMQWGLPIPAGVAVGFVVALAGGALLSLPALRVSGLHLGIATIALVFVWDTVLLNIGMTGGPAGLSGIPTWTVGGSRISAPQYVVLTGVAAIAVVLLVRWIVSLPFGRVLKGIREDEVVTQSLGKNVTTFKVKAFALGAAMASIAGGLYAHYFAYLNPYDYSLPASKFLIGMVVVGGLATVWGPAVGAVVVLGVPELLRFVELPLSVAAPIRQVLYSVLVLAFLMLKPEGLLGGGPADRPSREAVR